MLRRDDGWAPLGQLPLGATKILYAGGIEHPRDRILWLSVITFALGYDMISYVDLSEVDKPVYMLCYETLIRQRSDVI